MNHLLYFTCKNSQFCHFPCHGIGKLIMKICCLGLLVFPFYKFLNSFFLILKLFCHVWWQCNSIISAILLPNTQYVLHLNCIWANQISTNEQINHLVNIQINNSKWNTAEETAFELETLNTIFFHCFPYRLLIGRNMTPVESAHLCNFKLSSLMTFFSTAAGYHCECVQFNQ